MEVVEDLVHDSSHQLQMVTVILRAVSLLKHVRDHGEGILEN